MDRYRIEISGHQWTSDPVHGANTLRECAEIADNYGTTADVAIVRLVKTGRAVAQYRRNPEGQGDTWYRAEL